MLPSALGSTCLLHSKANLLTLGCTEAKYSIYLQGTKQGECAAQTQKTQTSQWLSRKGFLRQYLRWGLQVKWLSWLVGGEVTGILTGILTMSLLVPISQESLCLWSAYSHHPPPGWGYLTFSEQLTGMCQTMCISLEQKLGLCFVTDYCLNDHFFSCLNVFPSFLHSFTSLVSNSLCLLFRTQEDIEN